MSTFLDDFMDKMYTVPNSINRFLRLIRFLDKRVENLQRNLVREQKQFLIKMNQLKEKDKKMISSVMESVAKDLKIGQTQKTSALLTNPLVTALPLPLQEIISEYESIISIERQIVGYSKEKSQIGSQLTNQVLLHQQFLQKQMRSKYLKQLRQDQIQQNRLQQMPLAELCAFIKKKKQKQFIQNYPTKKKQQFFYDPKDDKFCYCAEPSYGDMVECENIYCQREWFHINCIQQKIQSDKSWYCLDCQKARDKTRNPISRSYFSSN